MSMTVLVAIVVFAVLVGAGFATLLVLRRRRTEGIRTRFGGAVYDCAMEEVGSRRHAEAGLDDLADGQASTKDLHQAMIHYRTLLEEFISEAKAPA